MSKCNVCGCDLGNVPMCFGSQSPASFMVKPEDYEKRVLENDDQCIIDDEHFFIRGHIEIPIIETNEVFIWSVWVSLSEKSFEHVCENWESEGREECTPYFGWLSTSLPCYPETLHLKTSIQSQPIGFVPLITVELTENPLSKEQAKGITMDRVHQIIHQIQQH